MTELGPIGPNPMPCCYGVYGKHNSYCPTLAARPSALVELLDELRTEIDIAKAQRTVRRDRSEGAVHISVEQAESLIAELSALKEDALTGYEAETVLHELLGKPNKGPEFDDRYEARERALVKLRRISSSK